MKPHQTHLRRLLQPHHGDLKFLLETGKTGKFTKFISQKTKRPFSAFLTINKKGGVDFEFEPREKKPAAAKGAKGAAKPDQAAAEAKPVEAKSA